MKLQKSIWSLALVGALAGASEFGYFGEHGPTHWADLSSKWSTCAHGLELKSITNPAHKHQSPVNFTSKAVASNPQFKLSADKTVEFEIENNGHTIEAVPQSRDIKMKLGGVNYTLAQFHFHAYSEHTQNSKPAAMEVHFVFKSFDGKLAVLGAFIDRDLSGLSENTELAKVFSTKLPDVEKKGAKVALNISKILPSASKVYSYSGSLTTPPCSEGVAWNVYTTHIALSEDHVVNFTKHYHNNFRPVTGNW